jgi:hypothetical protein
VSVFSRVSDSILAFPIEEAIRPYNCASFTVLHMTRKTANIGVKNFSVSKKLYGRVGILDLYLIKQHTLIME